jgi:iron complex transport system ATP-binding protein
MSSRVVGERAAVRRAHLASPQVARTAPAEAEPAAVLDPGGARVEAKAIEFSAAGRPILNGVDLVIAPGERLGIIGPNGSGKSTLLRCLYAWYRPSRGAVLLDGRDVQAMEPMARAREIAVLVQQSETAPGLSVRDVVALGRLPHRNAWAGESEADRSAIDVALASVGMTTWHDRPFAPLSGGEKQRILFARALAQAPSLLLLDEPTNHLDIKHQFEILESAHLHGISVALTLHDLNLAARWCDRVCLIDGGRICAVGHPSDVMTPEVIGKVYGVSVARDRDPRTGDPRLTFYPQSKR